MSTSNGAEPAEPVEKRESSPDSHIERKEDRKSVGSAAHRPSVAASAAERARRNLNAKLANPLASYTYDELRKMGRAYAYEHAIAEKEDVRALEIGACLARDPENVSKARELGVTDEEYAVLEKETTHRWSQPWTLYLVIILCSTCAAVQGMGTFLFQDVKDYSLTLPRRDRRQRRPTILLWSIRHWRR